MHESLFSLTISDNGKGIPQNMELESLESLGLQLVSILVNQLDQYFTNWIRKSSSFIPISKYFSVKCLKS